jgi:hypothetical protein
MTNKNDKPVVNFAVLQSVEDYAEKSGKFRTRCASFQIPGRGSGGASTLYIPYCQQQRFDFGKSLNEFRGHGVFTPPETGKGIQIMDFVLFREHFHDIHCPQPCRGYRNKTVAAMLKRFWSRPKATVGGWTGKEIVTIALTAVLTLAGGLLGWLTPEGRRWLRLDRPQPIQQTPNRQTSRLNVPTAIPPKDAGPTDPPKGPAEKHPTDDKVKAVVKPSSMVDWHDKHNWRKYLQTGLTKTDVRQIFGEPQNVRVSGDLEEWNYGTGDIIFAIGGGTPDGSLYSWNEPE